MQHAKLVQDVAAVEVESSPWARSMVEGMAFCTLVNLLPGAACQFEGCVSVGKCSRAGQCNLNTSGSATVNELTNHELDQRDEE